MGDRSRAFQEELARWRAQRPKKPDRVNVFQEELAKWGKTQSVQGYRVTKDGVDEMRGWTANKRVRRPAETPGGKGAEERSRCPHHCTDKHCGCNKPVENQNGFFTPPRRKSAQQAQRPNKPDRVNAFQEELARWGETCCRRQTGNRVSKDGEEESGVRDPEWSAAPNERARQAEPETPGGNGAGARYPLSPPRIGQTLRL